MNPSPQRRPAMLTALCLLLATVIPGRAVAPPPSADRPGGPGIIPDSLSRAETAEEFAARMKWWKEARFGLFIHWGLYAIPAGRWGTETGHGEWIRTSARIPLGTYDSLIGRFDPVKFDARSWVRLAKEAGMKYITITSKHHDGFCLFDSKAGDFDVMSTPFARDIMKEMADACAAEGIAICWYHSIMDWHHPDYLPRRDWENDRSPAGADFDRYVSYMKTQLKELTTNYGKIGVLWFDGEWEGTWDRARGKDLYDYVRGLQPGIIVNNRVGAGRSGMEGFSEGEPSAGDFGTPEQQIPATGLPGVYWETCMTMNDHWGYNSHDTNWKSSAELIRTLADIASKGGNFLLNVGPTAEGLIPDASVERLKAIGRWMKTNSEAIYATDASPFRALAWGRCTQAKSAGGARLFLHVFDWPADGRLIVPGIFNDAAGAHLLSDAEKRPLAVTREEDALVVGVGAACPDTVDAVVVLDLVGDPDVAEPPSIDTSVAIFIDTLEVAVTTPRRNLEIRYTTDGSAPSAASAIVPGRLRLSATTTISARCFRDGKAVSPAASATFTKVEPRPAGNNEAVGGLDYRYYEGDWDSIPDFGSLNPAGRGTIPNFGFGPRRGEEHFAFDYRGYIEIPVTGVYTLHTESDDGSRLFVGGELVVDNDGLHGMNRKKGVIALSAGLHPIRVQFFEKTGGDGLTVSWEGPGFGRSEIPDSALFRDP